MGRADRGDRRRASLEGRERRRRCLRAVDAARRVGVRDPEQAVRWKPGKRVMYGARETVDRRRRADSHS